MTTDSDERPIPGADGLYTIVRYWFPDGAVEFTYHAGCKGSAEEWAAAHKAMGDRPKSTACVEVYKSATPIRRNHILESLRKTQERRPTV